MNTLDFLLRLERYASRQFNEVERQEWVRRLGRFSPAELEKSYDFMVENVRGLPKISDLYAAAREKGVGPHKKRSVDSAWHTTPMPGVDCQRCNGIGLLSVWCEPCLVEGGGSHFMEDDLAEKVSSDYAERVLHVAPFTKHPVVGDWWKPTLPWPRMCRCDCEASERQPKIMRFSIEMERQVFAQESREAVPF